MQGFNWLFVNIGMNVIYKNDIGYQDYRKIGDPFLDNLPTMINPAANRQRYVLPYPEPEHNEFKPPAW